MDMQFDMQPAQTRPQIKRQKTLGEMYIEEATQTFQKYDTDNSGTIDGVELFNMITETFRQQGIQETPTLEQLQTYMQNVDQNQDGQISLDEYLEVTKMSLKARGLL